MSEKELNALESALRDLRPTAQPLNRDALLFRAGRMTATAGVGRWQVATAGFAFLALGFGIALASRSAEPRTVEHVVYVPAPPAGQGAVPLPEQPMHSDPAPAPPASPWEQPATRYEQVRDDVLRLGLDGLPPAPPGKQKPVTAAQVLWPF
jgi:hypothetical protein